MFTYQRPIIFITILYLITQYLSLVLVPLIFSQGIANYVVFIYIPVGLLFVILNHTEWRISIDLILMGTLVAIYITKSIYLCVLFEILCFLLLYKSIVKMFIWNLIFFFKDEHQLLLFLNNEVWSYLALSSFYVVYINFIACFQLYFR